MPVRDGGTPSRYEPRHTRIGQQPEPAERAAERSRASAESWARQLRGDDLRADTLHAGDFSESRFPDRGVPAPTLAPGTLARGSRRGLAVATLMVAMGLFAQAGSSADTGHARSAARVTNSAVHQSRATGGATVGDSLSALPAPAADVAPPTAPQLAPQPVPAQAGPVVVAPVPPATQYVLLDPIRVPITNRHIVTGVAPTGPLPITLPNTEPPPVTSPEPPPTPTGPSKPRVARLACKIGAVVHLCTP